MSGARVIVMRDETLRQRAIQVVRSLDLAVPYDLTLALHKKNRSLAQNRLLHVWLRQISEIMCDTRGLCKSPSIWKIYFKELFLGYDSFELLGKVHTFLRHTADLTVPEFTEFLDRVDHHCAEELGVVLGRSQFYEEAMGRL